MDENGLEEILNNTIRNESKSQLEPTSTYSEKIVHQEKTIPRINSTASMIQGKGVKFNISKEVKNNQLNTMRISKSTMRNYKNNPATQFHSRKGSIANTGKLELKNTNKSIRHIVFLFSKQVRH